MVAAPAIYLSLIFVFCVTAVAAILSVGIAVVVTIAMITIARASSGSAIEEDGHVVELLVLVVSLNHGQQLTLHQSGTDDKDSHICPFGDDTGISNYLHWGTVKEDEVVLLTKVIK